MSPIYSIILVLKAICIFAEVVFCFFCFFWPRSTLRNSTDCCPGNILFDTRHCCQFAIGQRLTFYLPCVISGHTPYQRDNRLENFSQHESGSFVKTLLSISDPLLLSLSFSPSVLFLSLFSVLRKMVVLFIDGWHRASVTCRVWLLKSARNRSSLWHKGGIKSESGYSAHSRSGLFISKFNWDRL